MVPPDVFGENGPKDHQFGVWDVTLLLLSLETSWVPAGIIVVTNTKEGEKCSPQPTSIQVRISVSCRNFHPAFTRMCSLEKTLVVKVPPDSVLKGNKLKHSLIFKNTPFILSLLKTYLKIILRNGGNLFLLMKLNHKNRDVTIGREK